MQIVLLDQFQRVHVGTAKGGVHADGAGHLGDADAIERIGQVDHRTIQRPGQGGGAQAGFQGVENGGGIIGGEGARPQIAQAVQRVFQRLLRGFVPGPRIGIAQLVVQRDPGLGILDEDFTQGAAFDHLGQQIGGADAIDRIAGFAGGVKHGAP